MRGKRAAAFRASLAVGAAVLLAVALVLLQPQLQGAGRQIGLAEEFTSQSNAAHSAIRQRLSGGQKRKGNKRKPQDAEVLPLEREAQSAETMAAEMEASLVGEIDLLQPSDKPCSDNTKRNSCKAVPKCEWDSAHGCSQRTGPDWDADYAAGGHGGTDGWGSAEGAAAAGGDGTAAAGGGTDAASKEGSGAVHTDAKWWEDGNADDDFVKTSPITVQNKTAAMPRFFDGEMERVPDATMDQIAKVLGNANTKAAAAATDSSEAAASAAAKDAMSDEDREVQGGVAACSVTNIFDTDNIFDAHPGATEVSVGIFVMKMETSRKAQKSAAANGEAATFFVDFLLTLTQPSGSTLWTDDNAIWDTLSFRNVKDIFESKSVEGTSGARRIQASFYYDPDLSMYPMDSQRLRIIVQQTKYTNDEWAFVPSPELNGMSKDAPDIKHKFCSADVDSEEIGRKQYSAFTYTVNVRKPRWFAIITAFIPPMLIMFPVLLGHTLGPLSWYPLRFMLSGFAFVSLAFFYDSFMRLLPILGYLTAFDKYIYCLYLWLIASIISLALMCRVFRDAVHDKEHFDREHGEGLWDETPVYLSVALRDDLLHMSMFSALITMIALLCVYVAWLFLPNVAILLLLAFVITFFVWWINASYHRLKQKHGLEQEEQGGLSRVLTKEDVERAKGRSFQAGMLMCCCYPPMIDICLEECCCCCIAHVSTGDTPRGKNDTAKDDDFPAHLYSPKSGEGGACAICRKAGYTECIFGHRHSTAPAAGADSPATATKAPDVNATMGEQ